VYTGSQPIGWVGLACQLQPDWAREKKESDVVQIMLSDRLLGA
jgi:hypothetical protein